MTSPFFRAFLYRSAMLLGASIAPVALSAQGATAPDSLITSAATATSSTAASAAAPSRERPVSVPTTAARLAPAGLTSSFSTANAPLPLPQDNANMGPNLALMGAGAAAVVVGLLIGGDGGTAIALGGGVVGLVGLYRYLR